jgi:hypothetical protein
MKEVLVGSNSTKFAVIERRKLLDKIRKDLSAKNKSLGLTGVVTDDAMERELHRRIILQFEIRKKDLLLRHVMVKGLIVMYNRAKRHMKIALAHRFKVLVGKCFYCWSDHVYLVGLGLDRKRWSGPRKYEVCMLLSGFTY